MDIPPAGAAAAGIGHGVGDAGQAGHLGIAGHADDDEFQDAVEHQPGSLDESAYRMANNSDRLVAGSNRLNDTTDTMAASMDGIQNCMQDAAQNTDRIATSTGQLSGNVNRLATNTEAAAASGERVANNVGSMARQTSELNTTLGNLTQELRAGRAAPSAPAEHSPYEQAEVNNFRAAADYRYEEPQMLRAPRTRPDNQVTSLYRGQLKETIKDLDRTRAGGADANPAAYKAARDRAEVLVGRLEGAIHHLESDAGAKNTKKAILAGSILSGVGIVTGGVTGGLIAANNETQREKTNS